MSTKQLVSSISFQSIGQISLWPRLKSKQRGALKLLLVALSIAFLVGLLLISVTNDGYNSDYDPFLSDERKVEIYGRMIDEYRRREELIEMTGSPSIYKRRPETQHVDCGRVLSGDREYTRSLTGVHRTPLIPDPLLDMSCRSVRRRVYPNPLKPLKVGVAFARIVYMDYEFIEKQLATSYHPQNVFCFAVDRKASSDFQRKIHEMTACFDNVFLLPVEDGFDSLGHNYNRANYKCMQQMIRIPEWNYLFLLQNHDVVTKTVYELERIYQLLGGANDVEITFEWGTENKDFRWDPRSMKLFRNESAYPDALLDARMTFAKGYSQLSLAREAVDWLVNTVNLDIFIDQLNYTDYASDEMFISSFQVNAEYGMPGHFTDECLQKGFSSEHISRMTQWAPLFENRTAWRRCATKTTRHNICLLGIEDFRTIASFPNLMANKMLPSFDYSIVECTAELLHNRTWLGQRDVPLDEEYYSNMVHVLYHKHHREPGFRLQCSPNHTTWNDLPYPV